MNIDIPVKISRKDAEQLLVCYAVNMEKGFVYKFYELYKKLYQNSTGDEASRVAYFIRVAKGLDGDWRAIY
jgi:hypothetical protein